MQPCCCICLMHSGPEVDRLAAIAGKYKVQLVMGVVEKLEVSLFSTVLFFDSHGQFLGKRRKVLPVTRECAVWNSGNEASIPVYGTPVGKIGALIGWDNRVPVLRTELYAKGILASFFYSFLFRFLFFLSF